jgi:hypothetical protein
MPNEGQGTGTAKSNGKPSAEQREHLLKHHLGLTISGAKLHVTYLMECGNPEEKPCPLPPDVAVTMCRRPPCPGL